MTPIKTPHKIPLKHKFLTVLLIEIFLLVLVAKLVGVIPVLLFTIITFLLGLSLLRGRNLAIVHQMQEAYYQKKPFEFNFLENALISFAGILLIAPGFLTDSLGIMLILPACRATLIKLMHKKNITKAKQSPQDPFTIEGEYWQEDDDSNGDSK